MGILFPHGRNLIRRCFSSLHSDPIHVCVVGSGPAGFYTAEKMLKAIGGAKVDILDRLPTPFGLVRSGVAPDHPETKVVVNQFSRVAVNERCSFFGNVSLGKAVSLSELREFYDVVVLAYGAESDRSLGIPGEELGGVHSAREFVWWYNGHPDCHSMSPDLKNTDAAVVLGQIFLSMPWFLFVKAPSGRYTWLEGVGQYRQLAQQRNCVKFLDELKTSRIQRRVYDLLSKAASSQHPHSTAAGRELHFVFFRKPDRFLSSESGRCITGVRLEKTCLKENGGSGKQLAVGTGQYEDLECGLAFKSIGYKSVPVDGLPFDTQRGVVPNSRGRVLSSTGIDHATLEHGLYVAGWLKRGPTGIIATNLYCAEETVGSISEDIEKGLLASVPKPGRQALVETLEQRNIRYVPFSGWQKIDSKERMEGNLRNKPREKIVLWDELLRAANE